MIQSTELLPCPFCGSPASWFKNGRSIGIECSAQMQEEGCPGCATTNVYDKDQREAVIHQWNRRSIASVKREPLSEFYIYELWESSSRINQFARLIEQAHGITATTAGREDLV